MRKFVLLIVLFSPVLAAAQACPSNSWCEVLNGSMPFNFGWNQIVFSHQTGHSYLYGDQLNAPSPWENSFWQYTFQANQHASFSSCDVGLPCWTEISSCGDTLSSQFRQQAMQITASMAAGDTTLTFGLKSGGSMSSPAFPQTGTVWVDDEAMDFTSCTTLAGTGTACAAGATSMQLGGLTRGQRTAAGYVSATTHNANDPMNLACPAPTILSGVSLVAATDHPFSRHPVGGTVYDSSRSRIWETWGFDETWSMQDTWYLPVNPITNWTRLALFTSGGQNINNPETVEMAGTYDPDHDAIFIFGGSAGGNPSNKLWIFCLSANTAWVSTGVNCTGLGTQKWSQVTPHGGSLVTSDAGRAVYDTVNHKLLIFGGQTSGSANMYLVQVYDPATGDVCRSDSTWGGTNAGSCAAGFSTSHYPASGHPAGGRFPSIDYDSAQSQMAYYGGPGLLFLYNASTNVWNLTSVAGGPTLPPLTAGASMVYDDVHSAHIWETQAQNGGPPGSTWQLPDVAISAPTTFTLTVTVTGTGSPLATGSTSDGATFTCTNTTTSPNSCIHMYSTNTNVNLTATPTGSFTFGGWSGDCTGTGVCNLVMNANHAATATFNPPPKTTQINTLDSGTTVDR